MSGRSRALGWLTLLGCALLLGVHGAVWVRRLPYPYDLEWMEGGMLAHAWRLQRGLPLYVRPNPDFVPYVYPPGYAAVLAALGGVFGLSPLLGRVVSLLASGATGAAAARITWRATGSRVGAAFAFTAFLGTYQGAGAFYDLVRPDALFVALFAWSLALALEAGRANAVAAGLLLAASFTMKQNAAAFGLPLALVIAWRHGWRPAVAFAAFAAVPAGLLALRWELASDGLFSTYLLRVPATHPWAEGRFLPGLPRDVGTHAAIPLGAMTGLVLLRAAGQTRVPPALSTWLPALCGVLAAWLGTYAPPPPETFDYNVPSSVAFFALGAVPPALAVWVWGGERRDVGLFEPVVLGSAGLAVTALMRLHNGGWLNVLVPLFFLVTVGGAIVLARLPVGLRTAAMLAHLTWSFGLLQRERLVPRPADYRAGERLVALCAEIDGPVFSPVAAWLPTYAGKPPSLHWMGPWDLDYPGGPLRSDLRELRRAVADHHWPLVLGGTRDLGLGLDLHYEAEGGPLMDPKNRVLMPKTGWAERPLHKLVPK